MANRLEQLESRRVSYEALSRKLFTLPHNLRHPGLIPVGPRLYLPGELVRTNEVTVLLGSDGQDSYFAERSAFQAAGIVQRRLKAIDQRVKQVDVDKSQVVAEIKKVETSQKLLKKKRVSFSEPVVTKVLSAPPSPKNSAKPPKSPKSPTDVRAQARTIKQQLDEAIANAQKQVLAEGVVNLTEVYEEGSEHVSRIELPDGFVPDSNINFDNGEEYLDITGASKAEFGSREEFMQGLLQAERDAELEEQQKVLNERNDMAKREEREFASGLARGFFGTPQKKKRAQAVAETEPGPKSQPPPSDEPVNVSPTQAVGEHVVERRVQRKGRKAGAADILARRAAPVVPNELLAEGEGAGVSKFRQMRSLQRGDS